MNKSLKLLSIFIAIALVFATVRTAQTKASPQPQEGAKKLENAVVLYVGSSGALVNNNETRIDASNLEVQPVIKSSRTLVPIRFITESLGAKVDWDSKSAGISIILSGKAVKLAIGSTTMEVNGKDVSLEVPAEIINNRTFVPLRQLAEALGKKVFYDRGLIVISDDEKIFDAVSDKAAVDETISRVNNLPVLGSYDNLKSLLEKAQESRNNMYGGGTEKNKATASSVMTQDSKKEAPKAEAAAVPGAKANDAKASVSDSTAGSADYSTTNVQVQGVDEADIVKTDGQYIYQVNKQRIIVARAYPADDMKVTSVLNFDGKNFNPQEMYLDGQKLVVIGATYNNVPVYRPEAKA